MGAWIYCDCGQGMDQPSAHELLYGRRCPSCGKEESFSAMERTDYLLTKDIEHQEQAEQRPAEQPAAPDAEDVRLSKIAGAMHYPQCWDTVAYPTIYDALYEMAACAECNNRPPTTAAGKQEQKAKQPGYSEPSPEDKLMADVLQSKQEQPDTRIERAITYAKQCGETLNANVLYADIQHIRAILEGKE